MKKILSLVLALAMLFALAACGNPAPSASSSPSASPSAEPSKLAGTYKYYEDKGTMGVMPWTIELGEDGSCTVTEHNSHIGDQVKVCDGWVDNGDGTFTTGAWESVDGPAPDFIDEVGRITWEIVSDGICQPVNGTPSADPSLVENTETSDTPDGDGSEGGSLPVKAGTYTYEEDKGNMGIVPWVVVINEDGTATVTEHNPHMGEQHHVCSGWTENDDGTFTTGAWDNADGPKSDFFAEDGTCSWRITSPETCEPVV